MPQIQVLPAASTFGSRLAQTLGEAAGELGQGFAQRRNIQAVNLMTQQLTDPQKTPMEKLGIATKLVSRLGPEAAKSILPLYAPFIFQQSQAHQTAPGGTPPGTPHQAGVPQGPTAPITADTQPQGVQNVPAPSGQTPSDLEAMRSELYNQVGLPYGIGERAKEQIKDIREKEKHIKSHESKKELQYLKANEPKLIEIADNQRNLKTQQARFERLNELFKDESKFPSATLSAVLSKDGQLRPIASSLLSPEAQESIKLIQDELSGAKDTFGARVTNFGVGQYLRRLPSLLNTPEGRQRVLRDLRLINEINQFHNEGIMKIFEEKGGSGSIPFSTAERLFEKQNKEKLDSLHNEFVNPSKSNFSDKPDASKYLGQKIRDKKTGEILVSDGKEWKPVNQ